MVILFINSYLSINLLKVTRLILLNKNRNITLSRYNRSKRSRLKESLSKLSVLNIKIIILIRRLTDDLKDN
jgi:hypothetical protein